MPKHRISDVMDKVFLSLGVVLILIGLLISCLALFVERSLLAFPHLVFFSIMLPAFCGALLKSRHRIKESDNDDR